MMDFLKKYSLAIKLGVAAIAAAAAITFGFDPNAVVSTVENMFPTVQTDTVAPAPLVVPSK